MWKGILKIILAVIHGLEVTVGNSSAGGVASAFHALEIAHTHYWLRETNNVNNASDAMSTTGSVSTTTMGQTGRTMSIASSVRKCAHMLYLKR